MIRLTEVLSTLQEYWQGAAPVGLVTQFPGVALDAAELDAWCEFWVNQLDDSPYRSSGLDRRALVIDVHCFARGADKRRAAGLADAAQAVLTHRELQLDSGSSETGVAWLRLREGRVRDLTRESSRVAQRPLQHVMVSLTAVVEEC